MLLDLTVVDLGAIERAEIALDRGSSALTGETGAGKTLVVAALGLLLGDRADRILVRSGAEEARVEGRFVLPPDHPVVRRLRAEGVLDAAEAEVVIARSVLASGRPSSARINGRLVTAALLADIGTELAEIAGQQEHQLAGRPAWQRDVLDSFAGAEARSLAAAAREAFAAATRAAREVAELKADERARSRELDVLRYEIAEIEAAGLRPGEGDELHAAAGRLEHAEALAAALSAAASSLGGGEGTGGDGGAIESTAEARAHLARVAGFDSEVEELRARLESVEIELGDISAETASRAVVPESVDLETVRDRLGVISRLVRKYGDDEEQVLAYLDKARAREAELAAAQADLPELERRATELRATAESAARRLSGLRRRAATELAADVSRQLGELAMVGARFEVALNPADLYAGGLETVEFRVAANPGEDTRPVSKVASGGELSRIALALYLIGSAGSAPTMVFDEVDAGVGGSAAQSVGRALARLARSGVQVIVVTHLPQVAAFAEAQYSIDKRRASGRSGAAVKKLDDDERVAELSRMLAGLPDSERGRGHARELLELAGESSR